MDPSDGHYQGSGFEQVIEHPESNLPLLNLSGSRVNVQGGTEQPPPDTTPVSHTNSICAKPYANTDHTLPVHQGECVYTPPCPMDPTSTK